MTLRNSGGDRQQQKRIEEKFEIALKPGKSTDWYDDALFYYAERLENYGHVILQEDGHWQHEKDFVKALELYRRIINEYQKSETRFFDQAKDRIMNITAPVVGASVSNIFLPDSEIQFYLTWRNTGSIDFSIYNVDLCRDVNFSGKEFSSHQWLSAIDLGWREKTKSWTKQVKDIGDYKPGNETIRLDFKLSPGAYVLQAEAKGVTSREIILVTGSTLVVKTSPKQALVYFCNALDGSPIPNANVKLWERSYDGHKWVWRVVSQLTNKDGICVFGLNKSNNYSHRREFYAAASVDNMQAFSIANVYGSGSDENKWRVYAFCDRPAYRPEEEVQWKFIVRRYNESVYTTPADQVIEFRINGPRGNKVYEEKARLNTFGSAWGSLGLNKSMPLGEYRVTFWDEGRRNYIGEATLFRLEEYKLPEFKVNIEIPQENGKKKSFAMGDTVEANIQANYYFGGPVANANVEVLVYQNPFYHIWRSPHDYPWLYEDMYPQRHSYYGNGQIIKREDLKTDADGKATVSFETPRNVGGDFEYRIEARVTNASRREIVSINTVKVTRQDYYVYLTNKHNIYRPQDKVQIDIIAMDANNQPVLTEGTISVMREYWFETWISSDGKEISGDELRRIREECNTFPPPPTIPNGKPWQLKFRGYEHDEILTSTIKTNAEGKAEFTFTPEREGYYRITWNSRDRRDTPIKTDTTVWIATNSTSDLGYRHGNMEIIIDKDTFKSGQKAPVMLSVPTNDRYILFSVEGEDIYYYSLVHLTGTVKLIELQIEDKHVPNIFLNAVMVSDQQIFMDTRQVVIPPVEHFLEVEVTPDSEQYEPQEEGKLSVSVRNHEGRPVSAEVALGLVDESVYYIQDDYAIDPRQYYYGTKRRSTIRIRSTLNQKSYIKLIEGDDKRLIDEKLYQKRDYVYKESVKKVKSGERRADLQSISKTAGQLIAGGGAFADEEMMEMDSVALNEASVPMEALASSEKEEGGLRQAKDRQSGYVVISDLPSSGNRIL